MIGYSYLVEQTATGTLAEWSKAPRSGRGLFGGVGSNPTGTIFTRRILRYKVTEAISLDKNIFLAT